MFLHDTEHVGCVDEANTDSLCTDGLYQKDCGGCARIAKWHAAKQKTVHRRELLSKKKL